MGSLEVIMGPMFSGKTELLIQRYNETSSKGNISKAYNYYKDTRYGDNKIVSHNGTSIESVNIDKLSQLFIGDNIDTIEHPYTHIFINEAQFFPDLKECVIKLVEEYNKHVVICGLDSDFKREKFGDMWDLIPYADSLIKLYGKCNNCSEKSLFTHRVTSEIEQEVIGNTNYIPLCRLCFINANLSAKTKSTISTTNNLCLQ